MAKYRIIIYPLYIIYVLTISFNICILIGIILFFLSNLCILNNPLLPHPTPLFDVCSAFVYLFDVARCQSFRPVGRSLCRRVASVGVGTSVSQCFACTGLERNAATVAVANWRRSQNDRRSAFPTNPPRSVPNRSPHRPLLEPSHCHSY